MSINAHAQLVCVNCGTETMTHETGLNEYNVYPCKHCYPNDNQYDED